MLKYIGGIPGMTQLSHPVWISLDIHAVHAPTCVPPPLKLPIEVVYYFIISSPARLIIISSPDGKLVLEYCCRVIE